MPFFVYIIYSEKFDVYYKGFTEDLNSRLEFHNTNKSKYTSGKGPWKLMYHEKFDSRSEAMKREKQRILGISRTKQFTDTFLSNPQELYSECILCHRQYH